ncbi:TIGR03757 family integrating conjugative element protein [Yersinia enterocolitica]|uniref:TIGR03757 family integrating conjugative element protein n=1 Tax=Yersinia enterocolitica TaxID=630 RepID=UPI00331098F3|nr:TIGR03757 family integrating conjugative element protein [Yersinia enterocolitica]EKN6050804.1 TIGR03757 family integrating conjugative element protein [Yersinia enterocolitica]HDL7912405.1 TIGR03757 family integrating conjugative element protein [Yersinia enterocolitica]
MRFSTFLLLTLTFAIEAQARTVVFTDNQHYPALIPNSHAVFLDAPETVQYEVFGKLPADPHQAELAAQAVLQSPDWKHKEQKIIQAYQGVLQAYNLKLEKYPAVVFDDRYVVYGTVDVALAKTHFDDFKRGK